MTDHSGGRPTGGGLHFGVLPAGYALGQYRVQSVLGVGGFGITYRAVDNRLRRPVAIKEFLPNAFAVRVGAAEVHPRSPSDREMFSWGLTRFLDEARTLAALKEAPNIVHVYEFLEANGTGYMVMELIEGEPLDKLLGRIGPIPPQSILPLLPALLRGMEAVHRAGYLHRDIKPANLLVRTNGEPVLVDFGAARVSVGERTQVMTSIYSPGYAPPEQYAQDADAVRQGPWSDIYAMAATLYHAITGAAPSDAIRRLARDNYVPLVQTAAGRFPRGFLAAIDAALALSAERRPQSVAAWSRMLFDDGRASAGASSPAAASGASRSAANWIAGGASAPGSMARQGPAATPPAPPSRQGATPPVGRRGRAGARLIVGIVAVVLIAGGAGTYIHLCGLSTTCTGSDGGAKACADELDRVEAEMRRVLATLPGQTVPAAGGSPGCEEKLSRARTELRRLQDLARQPTSRPESPPPDYKPPVIEPRPSR